MPNKTIYVSDDDLPLFERAQELSGSNLSSAIVRALRRYIELEEARQGGLDEITVIVNMEGAHRRKRFMGQRLVRWVQETPDGKGTVILNVYRTAGKRYALHTHTMPQWERSWGDPEIDGDPKNWLGLGGTRLDSRQKAALDEYASNRKNWGVTDFLTRLMSLGFDWEAFRESGNYTLQVFETLDELKPHVSADLFKAITLSMEGPEIEDIDI